MGSDHQMVVPLGETSVWNEEKPGAKVVQRGTRVVVSPTSRLWKARLRKVNGTGRNGRRANAIPTSKKKQTDV